MKVYEVGTLLRDCLDDLWMIAGYCKNLAFPTALPNAYDIVRLKDENFQKCWALDNLQPLEAIENLKKGNRVL
jgi:hypothetical protein